MNSSFLVELLHGTSQRVFLAYFSGRLLLALSELLHGSSLEGFLLYTSINEHRIANESVAAVSIFLHDKLFFILLHAHS